MELFNNNNIFFYLQPTASHLHPLQVDNCDSNSQVVVDEDLHSRIISLHPYFSE